MTFHFDDSENVRMLYDICRLMQSDEKIEDTFSKALGIIQNIVGCDSASLFLYNEQEKRLTEAASIGTKMELIETSEFEMGARVSAWIAKKRGSELLTDICKIIPGEFGSFISSPLVSEDTFIGVIHVGHKDQNYFTENHLKCIEIIAGQLAHKIERSTFEKELIEKNKAFEIAQKEIDKQYKQIVEMEKNQILGQIAAALNHEIANPLTTILGNVELILMKKTGINDAVEKKLRIVLDEGKRIKKMLEKSRNSKKIVFREYLDKVDEAAIDIQFLTDSKEKENLS